MNPRLRAITGPRKDSTYSITQDEISIGRDPSNVFSISDVALSRRHCLIFHNSHGFCIRDLESRNGTRVNGIAIRESKLKHGDQIVAGESVFLFLLEEETAEAANAGVEFDDSLTQTILQLDPRNARYLHPDLLLGALPEASRIKNDLNALLKISGVVHSVSNVEELQSQILEVLFQVVPAENGALLMYSPSTDQISVTQAKRCSEETRGLHVSRTITNQVLQHGIAVLGNDVPSGGFSSVESLIVNKTRSLLCVPLTIHQKVTGCIYLETSNPTQRFDENHLELAAAVAGISSVALENARRLQWLEQENLRLTSEINLEHNMIGDSDRMKEIYRFISRITSTDSAVLIGGESGTGKELAARAIHRNSQRGNGPFVGINCAAIPEGLLESELFGHERGAFTGAIAQKKGKIELADGGVLFLDEIGELAPSLQVKLLRVLQEYEFERVGGTRSISVNVRVITATNKNLDEAVKKGEFRADLYYRLNVISLTLPSLRERREDIPALTRYFTSKYCKKFGMTAIEISREALELFMNYDWPGNVRELENVIQRALVLSTGGIIRREDLSEPFQEPTFSQGITSIKYHVAVKDLKKQLILNALKEANGSYTEGARILGVHANYLHRLIRNLDLKDAARATGASLQ